MEARLIFTKSAPGQNSFSLPDCKLDYPLTGLQERSTALDLPDLSEVEVIRHFTQLSKLAYGVDDGFYPLGSCTMKHNPKLADVTSGLDGFNQIHPLQAKNTTVGCQKVLAELTSALKAITGMAAFSLSPAAGAHGEFLGLLLVRKYHQERKDDKRTIVLVPDSAHGTNPASANMCDYQVITIPSNEFGRVDLEKLKAVVDDRVACLMLTNPNTLGLFESEIKEIAAIVHGAGGLLYYDGANLNAIMGISNPRIMGFDIVHLNLHKTFGTPHGGGGPGAGPLGCITELAPYLPEAQENSVGQIKAFSGNFLVLVRALTYIKRLGADGLLAASQNAVLNANYLMWRLHERFDIPFYDQGCMHEFVVSLSDYKENKGISALDLAKAIIDAGIHPPTIYFPLIVKEALMIEPTETEGKERLDEFVAVLFAALTDPEIHERPLKSYVSRLDEVKAAREPQLTYQKPD